MKQKARLSADRWHQIERVFEEAFELSVAERSVFLDAACAGDSDLHREVASLLQAFDEPGPFDEIERVFSRDVASLLQAVEALGQDLDGSPHAPVLGASMTGQRIGPYRLVRVLGYGGMGTVYLAERADADFEQRVALKLVREGSVSPGLRRRFVRERQILARLEHPHIARFLDGGMADPVVGEAEGSPYLVMEYIEGEPLTAYCDAHRLSVMERLRLFETVCDAVHHAHQHLVVHRDLKPSNILVTHSGEVKLLDFGVSKLLTDANDGETLTRTGLRVMTPEYAAPEQVRGEPVTTATDVYALGVVLYELLTGHRPYAVATRTPSEIEHIICETEPTRPSAAVLQAWEAKRSGGETRTITPADVSRARKVRPEQLQRRLLGDLDTIVLKALAKEPDRRYASAETLLEDVHRHRVGLPVRARADTPGYRMRKFIRRHRRGVVVAVVLVLSLLAGLAGTTWQAQRATRLAGLAQAEAEKARQVTALLTDLFEQADPQVALGDTLTVFEFLDEGTRRVERELGDQPDVQAALLGVLGRAHLNTGDYASARRLLDEAMRMQADATPTVRMQALLDLGILHRELGEIDQADSVLKAALRFRPLVPEARLDLVGEVLVVLGGVQGDRGDWDGAEPYFEDALAVRSAHFGPRSRWAAMTLGRLADVATARGDGRAADSLYHEVLAIQRDLLGSGHPDTGVTLHHLSRSLVLRGEYEASIGYSEEAISIFRAVYGDEHRRLAGSLIGLAIGYQETGQLARADSVYRELLPMQRALYGGDHAHIAHALHNRAFLAADFGRTSEAEAFMGEALAMRQRLYGPENASVFYSHLGFAEVYRRLDNERQAEREYREALAFGDRIFGPGGQPLGHVLLELGTLLLDQGRAREAEFLLRRGLRILEANYPPDHPWVTATRDALTLTAEG